MTRVTLPATARVSKPDSVLVRELGGELVLLNLESESYFGLDDVGTRIWAALLASESIDAACAALQTEYDVPPEELRRDVADFVAELTRADLLHVVSP